MSQSVSKLKELLFEGEARALADLQRRIDTVASQEVRTRGELMAELRRMAETHPAELKRIAEAGERERADVRRLAEAALERQAELAHRLDAVFERAGTAERLETSVAGIIDGALRKAEIDRHSELAGAIAPLVVRTIKTEIRNSTDDLAEALYPMTGRMVKAYVASAMKDMVEDINRRLESNAFMLRLKSITTGRSVAELALAESQRVEVQEVYLIRRGSGELVGRWPRAEASTGRDQVMSGILTAINDFASEAFKGDGSALRQIDLETSEVYLRASPAYLLAVRCNGSAHAAVEKVIDDQFLATIDRHGDALTPAAAAGTPATYDGIVSELSRNLTERIAATESAAADPALRVSPIKILATLIALPLAAWIGWTLLEGFQSGRVRNVAGHVIDTSTEIKGYPVALTVEPWGRTLTLTGLAPSETVREDIVKRMSELLPKTEIRDQLAVVPTGGVDTRPQIAQVRSQIARIEADTMRISLIRTLSRARLRLEQALPDLAALTESTAKGPPRATVDAATASVTRAIDALKSEQGKLGGRRGAVSEFNDARDRLADLAQSIAGTSGHLAGLIGESARAALPRSESKGRTIGDVAEDVAAQAERLAAMAIAVGQANLLNKRPPPAPVQVQVPVQVPVPVAAEQTPRDRLEAWARGHAIFFGNGTDYRSDAKAREALDAAARLIMATDALVRIIGYTDEPGGSTVNATLSQARAARVQSDLVERGVPASRMVAIGRPQALPVSPVTGPQSPNRRVEFQLGFDGEVAQ